MSIQKEAWGFKTVEKQFISLLFYFSSSRKKKTNYLTLKLFLKSHMVVTFWKVKSEFNTALKIHFFYFSIMEHTQH